MKAVLAQGKVLLFFIVLTALCSFLAWLAVDDKLYSSSASGTLFEMVAGRHAYNAVYLYFAVFGLVICAFGLPISLVVTLVTVFSKSARAARKAVRRAAWERKQALEAEAKNGAAP